jgi:hypothetical protein
MVKPFNFMVIVLALLFGACSPSASGSAASSAELTGSYECFGLASGSTQTIGALTLNADGTGTFGSTAIQWSYDRNTNTITFTGGAGLQSATYISDGPSLSMNSTADAGVEGSVDGHFTCVRS